MVFQKGSNYCGINLWKDIMNLAFYVHIIVTKQDNRLKYEVKKVLSCYYSKLDLNDQTLGFFLGNDILLHW